MATIREGLSGLEYFKRMVAGEVPAPAMLALLGIRLIEAEEGRVVFTGTVAPEHYNGMGVAHGGYAATLLDSACGCSVHSCLTATQAYTTLELKVAYHKALTRDTGLLRAEGRVLSIGRRAAFAEATLRDASGRLFASATSTLLVMER